MGVITAQGSSMLRTCAAPGCSTLTLGRLCVAHEPATVVREFVRGRPFVPKVEAPAMLAELPVQLLGLPRKLSA
jgi:hypothetical protein